jgi:putative hemolysin
MASMAILPGPPGNYLTTEPMEILLTLVLMVVLLVLKGFFSGSEIAMVNADKVKLNALAGKGHKGSRMVLNEFRSPETLLGTTLVGTNIATIVLTTVGTLLMIRLVGQNGEWMAFVVLTPLLLVLGEIVPKSVYQHRSTQIAPRAIYPLRAFRYLFYPLVITFSRIARVAARGFGGGRVEQNVFMTRELIRSVVEMAERTSSVDAFDQGRIRRVIRFGDTTAGEVMIPIAEVTAINQTKSSRRAAAMVRNRGYNRLPVYHRNISNIIGITTITTWDMMDPNLLEKPLENLVKPALYVSPRQTIDQLLPLLRKRDDHMAVVVDEFGSAVGLITMEDIIEEVVGAIDVGYDFDEYTPKKRHLLEEIEDDVYLVDARVPISEANEVLGANFSDREAHTIGGLVTSRLRRIPKAGESIEENGFLVIVEDANERTALRLKIQPN